MAGDNQQGFIILENSGTINQNLGRGADEQPESALSVLLELLSSEHTRLGIPQAVPGTCQWFVNTEQYRTWRNHPTSSLFFLSAGPECGKSVLCRYLLDSGAFAGGRPQVCHFFFRDGQQSQTKAEDALSILHQLLFHETQIHPDVRMVLPAYRAHGSKLRHRPDLLWKMLSDLSKKSEAGEIICIIDAIDECEPESRSDLLADLVSFFQKKGATACSIKFSVSGRRYESVLGDFNRLVDISSYLSLDANEYSEDISRDIDTFLEFRLRDLLGSRSAAGRNRIAQRLRQQTSAQKTSLRLILTLDWIKQMDKSKFAISRIETELESIPTGLSDYHEKILQRIGSVDAALMMLKFVVAAERPLHLDEINVCWALSQVSPGTNAPEPDAELFHSDRIRDEVENTCGLFVQIYENHAYLLHQTAREFLLSTSSSAEATDDTRVKNRWKGRFSLMEAHSQLALPSLMCVCASSRKLHASTFRPTVKLNSTHLDDLPKDGTISDGLLEYAMLHWRDHWALCTDATRQMLCPLLMSACKGFEEGESAIVYAIDNDLEMVVDLLLRNGEDINQMRLGRTLISNALWSSSRRCIDLLIDVKADLLQRDQRRMKLGWWKPQEGRYAPVQYACNDPHLLQKMLRSGLDVAAAVNLQPSLLILAAASREDMSVILLLHALTVSNVPLEIYEHQCVEAA